ncbi:zinc-binding alcohol dehydrogenase family protein [Nocardia sp. NPDC127526]|uniref:quinone oxidoreductase family protein n=1 Tax=Nocardia sp. NPDC127526 TaxID=3345393 RepID=UPI0036297CC6
MRKIQFSSRAESIAVPEPEPGPGQLLVRTELVGVGVRLVQLWREGALGDPGGEMVGAVVAVGPGVPAGWVGKRVGGLVFEGVYAEYVLAAPQLITELPAEVEPADALALVRGGLVGMGALRASHFAAGESVLVIGAASGVGHLAVQLARALGASRVLAAAGSAGKAGFLRECGADAVFTYDDPWNESVDVVLDGVGGPFVQRGVNTLAPHGRLVAFSAGGGTVDASGLLTDLKTVTGFAVGLLGRTRPEVLESYRAELWRLLAAGELRPQHTVLPWDRMDTAIDLIETRRNLGRVAVRTAA